MALFLDGTTSTIDDLTGYDSQLLDVASTERIDVTRKLALAQDEVTVELQALLARSASQASGWTLANVVITPALRLWHAYRTLEMVYGDAYNSQLNDRYAGRRDQFRRMADWARDKLMETGLGMASSAVPAASVPVLTIIPGLLPEGTYYITVTYVSGTGEEGRQAPTTALTNIAGGFIATVGPLAAGVTGWNLYAGSGPSEMTRQNATVLQPAEQWVQSDALATGGPSPTVVQTSVTVRAVPRVLLRG